MISNENFEEYLKALGEFYIDNCDNITTVILLEKLMLTVVQSCCL